MIHAKMGLVPVELEYEYDRGESMTMHHPGSPAYAIVTAVWIGGVECEPEYFDADLVIEWEELARRDAEGLVSRSDDASLD